MSLKGFCPNEDRILIKRLDDSPITPSSIVIPETSKDKGQRGQVLAIGPGSRDSNGNFIPVSLAVGQVVYFGKYAGTELEDGYLVLSYKEIIGYIQQ